MAFDTLHATPPPRALHTALTVFATLLLVSAAPPAAAQPAGPARNGGGRSRHRRYFP